MSKIRYAALAGAYSLLLACVPAPIHYYTLTAPEHSNNAVAAVPFLIEVLPVGIPAGVDQPQLVIRQGDGGVEMLDNERWIAPLNEELRAALSAELVQALGTQDVAGLARPTGQPILRIKMQVRRFDSVAGHYASMDADWSLSLADNRSDGGMICHSRLREAAPGDYMSLARGHQQIIIALASQISNAARILASARPSACPQPGGPP